MKLKKNAKIILGIVAGYLIFAGIVAFAFFSVRDNPKDMAARTFLLENDELNASIGEITSINRYIFYKEVEDDKLKLAYHIYSYEDEYYAIVDFVEQDGEWIAIGYELQEKRP